MAFSRVLAMMMKRLGSVQLWLACVVQAVGMATRAPREEEPDGRAPGGYEPGARAARDAALARLAKKHGWRVMESAEELDEPAAAIEEGPHRHKMYLVMGRQSAEPIGRHRERSRPDPRGRCAMQ